MAPKKKEKNLKRSNIITLKLTDIELAVLNEAADVTGLSRSEYLRKTVQLQVLIELVLKWNNCCSIEKKSFSFPGIRHIRQLIWGNIQLFCKDLSVTCSLVQHQDKITVLKDIFNFPAGKKIFDILCDSSRYASPFSESLPDFYGISCCLFFFEQKVEFIDIVPGRFDATVDCNSVPYLIVIGNPPLLPYLPIW